MAAVARDWSSEGSREWGEDVDAGVDILRRVGRLGEGGEVQYIGDIVGQEERYQ